MKGVVHIGHHLHLLAPSVAAASQLTQLLARCQALQRTITRESADWEYVVAEGPSHDLTISVDVLPEGRVRTRVPKARRITAPAAPAETPPNASASATPGEGGQHGS